MIQLILHLWGDYITQSDWMVQNKTKHWWPALVHSAVYSSPFLLIGSLQAVGIIFSTHYLIDRFRLARYLVWMKNFILTPSSVRWGWQECSKTGNPPTCPDFMAVWLMILADNTLHLTINFLSLRYL